MSLAVSSMCFDLPTICLKIPSDIQNNAMKFYPVSVWYTPLLEGFFLCWNRIIRMNRFYTEV